MVGKQFSNQLPFESQSIGDCSANALSQELTQTITYNNNEIDSLSAFEYEFEEFESELPALFADEPLPPLLSKKSAPMCLINSKPYHPYDSTND